MSKFSNLSMVMLCALFGMAAGSVHAVQINASVCDKEVGSNGRADENIYASESAEKEGCGWECGADGDERIKVAVGDTISLPANHFWDNNVIAEATTYVCAADGVMFGDHVWRAVPKEEAKTGTDKKEKSSDEYLYRTESDYKNGIVYECGTDETPQGTIVTMPAGHYFDGESVAESKTYYCEDTPWDERWRVISGNDGAADAGDATKVSDCGDNDKCKTCVEAAKIGDSNGWIAGSCDCGFNDRGQKRVFRYDLKKCMTGTEYCLATRTTDEGKACCYVQNAKWTGTKCQCNAAGAKFVLDKNNLSKSKCVVDAVDPGWNCPDKDFADLLKKCENYPEPLKRLKEKIAELNTFCQGKGDAKNQENYNSLIQGIDSISQECTSAPFSCNMTLIGQWLALCAGHTGVLAEIISLQTLCQQNAMNQMIYNQMISTLSQKVNTICTNKEQPVNVDETIKEIKKIKGELDMLAAGFEKSVWRDIDGEFNTARLASDSIAAVVLGTTGGLVTSTVMKKKQVENGFEDLQCTIGGQVVATWGDQFSVGIQ